MIEDILGVDLGGSKMHFIIYHDGKLIEERYPTGVDCTSEPIRDHLYDFLDRLGFKPRAIGMAIPGGVNAEGTFITLTDSLPMTCYTPASYFTRDGIPIRMLGDMHSAILAAAEPYPDDVNVTIVMMGSGVAYGSRTWDQASGKVVYGGMDLGYIVFDTPEGPKHLNSIAGGRSILRAAGMEGPELAQKVREKDPKAMEVIDRVGYFVGMAMSTVRLTAHPKVIALGGGASTYEGMFEKIRDTFDKTCLPLYREGVEIIRPNVPTSLVGEGAIIFARDTFFPEERGA